MTAALVSQVNLHNHTDGSFFDGLSTVTQAAERALENGSNAIAFTDHNEVNRHIAAQKACKAVGIKAVLGIEADWVYDVEWTRKNLTYPKNRSHICMLAEDNEGLSNIWAMSSIAYTDKYRFHKPLLTPDVMRQYSKGVWASDGCMITELGRAIERGDEAEARQHYATLLDIYGDRFYTELHTWQFMEANSVEKVRLNTLMADINQAKVRFATEMGVPMVVVNDSHHAWPEMWENKELNIKKNKRKNEDEVEVDDYGQKADHIMAGGELYFWMERHGIPAHVVDECIKNSQAIADSCHAEVTKTLDMPRITASEEDDLKLLLDQVEAGFQRRVIDAGLSVEKYYPRIEEELRLIANKRFAGYFNVVQDYVGAAVSGKWAGYVTAGSPDVPMLVGPGRGSAGGSLVAYVLGITTVDPIHYDLLFERFLAPGRKDSPDIDLDFPQSLRGGQKSYLEARFGADCVCTIGTLTHSQPKAMLKDLVRAMDIPFADGVAMSKIIEQVSKIVTDIEQDDGEDASWEDVVQAKGGELAKWATQYPELFDKLNKMVGIIRQSGVHPSGVLVADKAMLGRVPLRHRTKDEMTVTQFDMYEVEELGAVKFDILGLRHLDTLMEARNLVYERHGIWLDYRGDDLPAHLRGRVGAVHPPEGAYVQTFSYEQYADPNIWPQIDAGDTAGVFQLETPDLTRKAMELKPRNEVDLAALISIVRPGVKDAGLDAEFIRRRSGESPIVYDHPMMEQLTSETYGILVYQEQMMKAVRLLASFSADEADDLRKALGKKKADKIAAMEQKFLDGCLDNQDYMAIWNPPKTIDNQGAWTQDEAIRDKARGVASHIWASIAAAGRYAFNKSHAVEYAVIPNWEIWTKYYFPEELITAGMATDSDNINRYVRSARRRGIEILPPDVNLSGMKFTIIGHQIRYGLDTIRGVGESAVTELLKHRPFASLEDMVTRCDSRKVGKTQVEALIKIGALDELYDGGINRMYGRHELMCRYQDHQIFMKAAESVRAKKADPADRAAHIAAWRAKHLGEAKYEAEFGAALIPNFEDSKVLYEIEQELVGNYILMDPMGPYIEALDRIALKDPADMEQLTKGQEFIIGGMVTEAKTIKIKKEGRNKGREMAFLKVEWNEQDFEITIFPDKWEEVKAILRPGDPVALHVKRDDRGCNLVKMERLDMMVYS